MERERALWRRSLLILVLVAGAFVAAGAASAALPLVSATAQKEPVRPVEAIGVVQAPSVDRVALSMEDDERDRQGLPPRYAIPNTVSMTPSTAGTWEELEGGMSLWRLRITSPGASSLNLGFGRYRMPEGGRLLVYALDMSDVLRPFTAADNADHRELWTPIVSSDDIIVELTIPVKAIPSLELELTSINVGYRGFAELLSRAPGSCNIDVICPQGDPWRGDIRSVGVISTGGSTFCTGFMVNNTAGDATPYFMTANHCGITSGNAASLVVYWNFQSPTCGQLGGGSLTDYQTGSYFRAGYSTSDFTLVELDEDPAPRSAVTFAGWSNSSADPTSATCIHQPDADVKCISFENDPCQTTTYLGTSSPGNGSHIRVVDWDVGTTEPGSSGSPLFDQNHHVVGQLHGGYAACGNNSSDWFGRFSMSWTGGGTNATRLSNWLDPGSTGATTVGLLDPNAVGLKVTPSTNLVSAGEAGGPFTPGSIVYTLENQSDTGIDYLVTKNESWISLANASGHLNAHATADVTVAINSNANLLGNGTYTGAVQFTNTTDHSGDTTRNATLKIGIPELFVSFPMDANPGWATEGLWAWGHPTGGGGQHGGPDPTSGHTGTNVYGYNLAGDYENSMPERHLTTTAIDCSDLSSVTLKFWRWLGVELSTYDHAYVRVSNDGVNYTTIWQNPSSHVQDTAWSLQEFDISALADGKPNVTIRWTMGTTDSSWQFCGWNIDDVEIWGVVESPSDVADGANVPRSLLSPNFPNPFSPSTAVRFEIPSRAHVNLSIYDVAGRLVKTLVDADLGAGPHALSWDGKNEGGADAASGIYFCRLEAGTLAETRRMVLVR